MIKLKCIEKGVSVLKTPYCDITVTDENGNPVIFDVMETPTTAPTVWIDDDENKEEPISNWGGRTLRIYTKDLELKKNYYIRSSAKLEYCDADERLYTYGITGDTYTFAISFPDPNDTIKDGLRLINGKLVHVGYTEDELQQYDIKPEDHEFVLRLLDRSEDFIDLFTFWIWDIHDHMDDYESACEVETW